MKKAKNLRQGLYMTPNGKIVGFKNVQIHTTVLNEETGKYDRTAALLTWIDENGRFPKTMIRGDQFKEFYRLGGL